MAINNYGVLFNGRRIVHPGAYDKIVSDAMTTPSGGAGNLPIIVGTSDAGRAGEILWFTDYAVAKEYLRGGDVLTAVDLALSPAANGGGGASRVGVLIVNPTKAAKVEAGGLEWVSKEYGEGGNRVQVKLENGTLTGSKRITVSRWDLDMLEVFDNAGAVLTVKYTGSSAYASINVTRDSSKATKLTTKVGTDSGSASEDLTIDLTSSRFPTIAALAEYINSISGYSAKVTKPSSGNLSVSKLDAANDKNIKTESYLLAVEGDINHITSGYSALITANIKSVGSAVNNFDYTYLAGGEHGTTPVSWTDSFSKLKKAFYDVLVVLSSDASIQAEAKAHIGVMETRNQKQMLFTGMGINDTVEDAIRRAAQLNSSRVVLGYPGIYVSRYNNGEVPLPAYFFGAMLAGRVCGVDPTEPITFDYFDVIGLTTDLVVGDPEIDDLITSGVAVLEKVQNGGFRLVQGITTYISANNALEREISIRRGADALSTRMITHLENTFIGTKAISISGVNTEVVGILEDEKLQGNIIGYRNVAIVFKSGAYFVTYEVAPVEPTNYIFVTSKYVPQQLSS